MQQAGDNEANRELRGVKAQRVRALRVENSQGCAVIYHSTLVMTKAFPF
jgi:hypothetical protein